MAARSRKKTKTKANRSARSTSARRSTARPRATARSSRAQGRARLADRLGARVVNETVPADALALLEQDHREVESLYAQFEEAETNSEKAALAEKICLALTVHAEIEETILYPRAKKVLDESDLVDEAEVEHASAKQLIAEIEAMSPRERLFDAKVKVLVEYVKHHVQEEENELFPQLRASGLDLVDLGRKLLKRKVALLEEMA